jgi:hypothetical protein
MPIAKYMATPSSDFAVFFTKMHRCALIGFLTAFQRLQTSVRSLFPYCGMETPSNSEVEIVYNFLAQNSRGKISDVEEMLKQLSIDYS